MTEALIPVSGFPLSELNVCRLCRDAVPTLPVEAIAEQREEGGDVGVGGWGHGSGPVAMRMVWFGIPSCSGAVAELTARRVVLLAVAGREFPDDSVERVERAVAQAFRSQGLDLFPECFGRGGSERSGIGAGGA